MCVTNEPSNIFISKMITTLTELHMQYDGLDQGSPSSVLEGQCPAEFSSNPN